MKKIINGKLYNTESAVRIGGRSHGNPGDFFHFQEELYRKKTGEFFLFGEGGAMSRYSQRCGDNSWGPGEEIIPLTIDEAKKWVEMHLDAEDYIALFGCPDE